MQNAVILINVEKGRIRGVAEQLADLEGISEVYSTCGRYDLIAIARTRDFESLATLVTERLMSVEGIRDTETLNAMQVHSRHDLDAMFSVGL
ncbi:Lrp/AsnC ligand binding domain-containing protein [Salinicola sp. LHM]|uniref:Lrp/AsnC family transcriptional regulator n=1 Tax=Salinicola TaxID=404432 RepID=UPI0008DE96D3|nr:MULTISPECIES: Lrp/AsnC ligand binding domain-containing protein [Salinicola]MEC8916929.1 Lrp/AsnC ligand binding domain-containing protein [Pseudomonadota bacterium]MDF3918363.1 Lrp/AsnC ligand binding domain-containing protein [Salinicola salarius]MED5501108.1 Lrp/AsnC ligand binding domain-containing protein [Pseudomonadota bacterium]OHZ01877.1 AsnC family transcriptional regulator [Salinicola sp. MIT1003]WQH32460.1 Lrp/AsnC ligand binding domain-containing protein [Salinicola sp. LHM]